MPSSFWVTNADDPAVEEMTRPVPGTRVRFSIERRADAWYDRAGGRLMLGDTAVLAPRRASSAGRSQRRQCAGGGTGGIAGRAAPLEGIAQGLRSFRAIPHRVEPVREVNGVLWINDSKSTNITSTEVAVAALDRQVRAAAGWAAQGRAVHPTGGAASGSVPGGRGIW